MERPRVLEFVRSFDPVWDLPRDLALELDHAFPEVEFLHPPDRAAADRLLPEADAVVGWAVRRENFSTARQLRWVQITAASANSVLFPELIDSPVVVTNARGLHADSMAEHTLGVMLAFARKLHLSRDAQRRRDWAAAALWRDPPPFGELRGTTVGLVGYGAIGRAIAERCRAFGMRMAAVRRRPVHPPDPADPALLQWGPEGLDDLLAVTDWLVLAVPLTPATRGLIGAAQLARLKPGAVLINLGRGALVDEKALVEALSAGRLAGAALDVFEEEPLPVASPLWDMPQVIVTPHVSGFGPRYWERALEIVRRNLRAWLDGAPLENLVDKQAGY